MAYSWRKQEEKRAEKRATRNQMGCTYAIPEVVQPRARPVRNPLLMFVPEGERDAGEGPIQRSVTSPMLRTRPIILSRTDHTDSISESKTENEEPEKLIKS